MVQRRPSTSYTFPLTGAPTGLVGTLTFQLENAITGATVQAATSAGIVEVESGAYNKTVTLPATAGIYQAVWKHGAITIADPELVEVTETALAYITPTQGLITKEEYKAIKGINHTRFDSRLDAVIPGLSQAVLNYTERDFGVVPTLATKEYLYDGSGILEINDATTVTSVAWVNGSTVDPKGYVVYSQNGVLTWIEMPPQRPLISPEMGFTYNLDRLYDRMPPEHRVAVTGTFGWRDEGGGARVPSDVRLALVWAVEDFMEHQPDVTGEAIASYSVQYAQLVQAGALSDRARDMLDAYKRVGF